MSYIINIAHTQYLAAIIMIKKCITLTKQRIFERVMDVLFTSRGYRYIIHHIMSNANHINLQPRHLLLFINPRRACAARVTVVVLSVCLSVCLSVHILFSDYRLRDGL